MEITEKKQIIYADVAKNICNIYTQNLLTGKIALVTGGSRGIGRAISIAFGALGAKVIVNYAGNSQAAEEVVTEIKNNGGMATCVKFDVSDHALVQETMKALEKEHGSIDILVNNAGISKDNLFVKFKEDEWDQTLDTNLKGAFNCSKAVTMGMMKKRSGKIINISSVIGLTGNAGQSAYAASKAGVIGLTKSLARELASRNVQVNAIAPGYISTDMTNALDTAVTNKIIDSIPAAKIGDPLEIASAAVFLASPAGAYVTGQTLAVDGGMTMC
ncbi:3-oxoacyl-[acyl-carrier-protein] reductase [Spirobacillus cienkowskii]|uniref:3-oxoacyl-[acyl-carrier-protein] reductase n=1 Tax=Spirobacillus cienkowskii TaxID=495820 RepID=A0A369KU60_9BACT|nr:MAG: 3-oxoacyl-[acyl-carrier-protein] reductase [Spirobacillus cienkowskii]